jgi:ribosomal protein S12 methylthiotransferase accessory factor
LVVRSTKGSFMVPADRRDLAVRLLRSLDGQHGLEHLLSGYAALDAFSAIGLVSALAELGLVVERAGRAGATPAVDGEATWPAEASVAVLGVGLVSDAIRDCLTQVGARLSSVDATFSVLGLEGPDIAALDAENRAAYDAGRTWMPVFPFGDAIVVGPLIRPGHTACFRCFELRWLGMSPSIALERRYLSLLRSSHATVEVEGGDQAARLAERVVPLLARQARDPEAPTTVWLLSTDDDTTHESRLEAHPRCEVCAKSEFPPRASRTFDADSWNEAGRDVVAVAGDIAGLVDRYFGVAAVVRSPQGSTVRRSPAFPAIVLARYSVPQPDLITTDQSNLTHGSGDNEDQARAVALMEAIERYCGLFPPQPDIICRFADLNGTALLPTELPLFSTSQYATPGFPYRPFEPDLVLGWTWGWNVSRSERVLVPSSAVWYGAEDLLVGETSSGMAAHSGRGQALYNGVLELIERDAFMIHWLHRISPPLFDRDRLQGDAAATVDRLEEQAYKVVLADITTDLKVPVVLALGVHELGQKPALLVGAGASLDSATALRRALRELYAAATGIPTDWTLRPPLSADDVVELEDHSRAYEHPDWLPHASFLWAGQVMIEPPDDPPASPSSGSLRRLVEQLASNGQDVIGVDISTPEVARCGVRVVRAIVPGLQPLAFGTRVRLGGCRLYEAPRRMDDAWPILTEADLNPVPHCFP